MKLNKEEIEYLFKHYFHLLPLDLKHTIKYPYLNEVDLEEEKVKLSAILIEKYGDKVFWNLCPECNKLARTPKAKQCRFCGHNWH